MVVQAQLAELPVGLIRNLLKTVTNIFAYNEVQIIVKVNNLPPITQA